MAVKAPTKPESEAKAVPEVETCVHHWIIAPPEGPTSTGVCKKCGAVKEFENHVGFSNWDNETATLRRLGLRNVTRVNGKGPP